MRLGLPTLLVVRTPDDAVCSLLVAAPHVTAMSAYREWIHHHRELMAMRDAFVVASLPELIDDFGRVVQRLNHRFRTLLPADPWTPDKLAETRQAMEAHHRIVHAGAPHTAPWPSEHRVSMAVTARRALADPDLAVIRRQADELYASFVACSTDSAG